jgi:hypothetical protein
VSGETARAAGTGAVDREMDKANTEAWSNRMRASAAGKGAVGQEMDKAATEAWQAKMQGRKADVARAGSEGQAAVADATSPSRVRDMMSQLAAQPGWTPEESAAWARALGQVGVENALHTPQNPPGWTTPLEPMPLTAPGTSFAPHQVATPDLVGQTPYAPAGQRASHYGKDAVARELDKEPD